jgi:peroxiredoxin Q/BCP
MSLLSPGEVAPDFSLTATDGSVVKLSERLGSRVVLYFYPRDDTPGCTIEACSFRDNLSELTSRGVEIFGVSDDNVASHEKFSAKYDLNFLLLADTEHGMLEDYGAWVEKKQYGRNFMGTQRVTYLIDPDGKIEHVWPEVVPKDHVAEILELIDA